MKPQNIGKLYWKDLLKEPNTPLSKILIWLAVFIVLAFFVSHVFGESKIKMIRPFDDSIYPVVISGRFGAPRSQTMGGTQYEHTGIDY